MKTFIISYTYIWEQYFSTNYENFNNKTYKEAFNAFAEKNNCILIDEELNTLIATEEDLLLLTLRHPNAIKGFLTAKTTCERSYTND